MTDIPFSSIDKQIEKLVSQNLIIEDTGYAKYILELFGYSNLIKSYREPYVIKTDTSIQYRSGVTFEQIHSLYMLDKNLRNSVMSAMQDLEEHIKETAASVVAETFGTNEENYLDYRNYRNKKKRKKRFTLPGILDTLKKTLDTDKIQYHIMLKNTAMFHLGFFLKAFILAQLLISLTYLKKTNWLSLLINYIVTI